MISEQQQVPCLNCGSANRPNVKFCSSCGKKLIADEKPVDHGFHINRVFYFFFGLLAYIGILHFAKFEGGYLVSITLDSIFAAIVLVFFFLNFKRSLSFLKFNGIRIFPLIIVLIGMPLFGCLVFWFGDVLNKSLFSESAGYYYTQYMDAPSPLLFALLSVALFPALFEELAFRGVLFDDLRSITGKGATIVITSVLFTILHFSLFSLIWIFPIGLLFGFFRAKYNTVLYGMIGHFLYNGTIILLEVISINTSN